jgi:hypothetical protein
MISATFVVARSAYRTSSRSSQERWLHWRLQKRPMLPLNVSCCAFCTNVHPIPALQAENEEAVECKDGDVLAVTSPDVQLAQMSMLSPLRDQDNVPSVVPLMSLGMQPSRRFSLPSPPLLVETKCVVETDGIPAFTAAQLLNTYSA